MNKLIKKRLLSFIFFLFLITPAGLAHASPAATYTPTSITTGGSVNIVVSGLQATHVFVAQAGLSNGAPPPSITVASGCSLGVADNNLWTNVTCATAGDGTMTLTATYNTASDIFLNPALTYAAYYDWVQLGSGFSFSNAPPVSFTITTVSPSPTAKEGDTLSVTIGNATNGHLYALLFQSRDQAQNSSCSTSCTLSFTVPYVDSAGANAQILDRTTGEVKDVPVTFMASALGNQDYCLKCPSGSTYSDTKSPKGCYGNTTGTLVSPSSQILCQPNETCPIQGQGCVAAPTPTPCPNCTGVDVILPGLNAIGLGGVPQGGRNTMANIISLILGALILIAIVLSLLYLAWGGFNWITSEGDKTRLESARQKVIYAILGLVVVFLSFVVINLIYQFFFRHLATGVGL